MAKELGRREFLKKATQTAAAVAVSGGVAFGGTPAEKAISLPDTMPARVLGSRAANGGRREGGSARRLSGTIGRPGGGVTDRYRVAANRPHRRNVRCARRLTNNNGVREWPC